MTALDIILISLLLLAGVVVIVSVLLQHSKSEGLSGTITGGGANETYFGKNNGSGKERILRKITIVSSIVFVVLVLLVYVLQVDLPGTL